MLWLRKNHPQNVRATYTVNLGHHWTHEPWHVRMRKIKLKKTVYKKLYIVLDNEWKNNLSWKSKFYIYLNNCCYYCLTCFLAYFPQDAGTYPVILFLGGFNTIVLAEYYETFLYRIASHGFFVFGIDYEFPVDKISTENRGAKVGQDISKYFKQYEWVCIHLLKKRAQNFAFFQNISCF